jgi:hypothetical protein
VVRILGEGVIQVSGVRCGKVILTEETWHGNSCARVAKLIELFGLTQPNTNLSNVREGSIPQETFCMTLAAGYLRDRFPNSTLPSLAEWKNAVFSPNYLQKLLEENVGDSLLQFHEKWLSSLLQESAFFKTDAPSIALGPQGVKKGQG